MFDSAKTALDALYSTKRSLLDDPVYLTLNFKSSPLTSTGPFSYCELPNSTQKRILIIAKTKLKFPNTKVVEFEKIKNKCASFEYRRKLVTLFDVVLYDATLEVNFLGKRFLKAKKFPIPVDVSSLTLDSISKFAKITMFRIPNGTCVAINIGTLDFESTQLQENLIRTYECVLKQVPQEFIVRMGVRTQQTPSLCFFSVKY